MTGTYNLRLVATETWSDNGPKINNDTEWTVTVSCASAILVQTNPIPAETTFILDPNNLNTQTLTLPTYVSNKPGCPFEPVYEIKLIADGSC